MYLALIGDIIGSRNYEPERRKKIQIGLEEILTQLNKDPEYTKQILSKFIITEGDEFQGLLDEFSNPFRIIRYIQIKTGEKPRFRFGIGGGTLLTSEIKDIAIGMDGECWYNARDSINIAKKQNLMCYIKGIEKFDTILNLLFYNFYTLYFKLTENQRRIYNLHFFFGKDVNSIKKTLDYSTTRHIYVTINNWKLECIHRNELAINDIFQSRDLSLNSYRELFE